ncbi:hypothetical protein EDD21DRAFT_382212 [Dissophora ornata]|nr:hypothetical protein EDD21DRAFT_382212 [Dissophora ornata]
MNILTVDEVTLDRPIVDTEDPAEDIASVRLIAQVAQVDTVVAHPPRITAILDVVVPQALTGKLGDVVAVSVMACLIIFCKSACVIGCCLLASLVLLGLLACMFCYQQRALLAGIAFLAFWLDEEQAYPYNGIKSGDEDKRRKQKMGRRFSYSMIDDGRLDNLHTHRL